MPVPRTTRFCVSEARGERPAAASFAKQASAQRVEETARFGGGEGRVERGRRMRAEIVLDQPDLFGVGKMHVGQFLEHRA